MTDEQIETRLAEIILTHDPDAVAVRERILFDDVTVPPPPNIETCRRHEEMMADLRASQGKSPWERKPWRNASPSDRYRMLQAAWRRETGEDLADRLVEDLGPRAIMEIEVDLADDRDWMAWPKVRLKHARRPPEAAAGPLVIEGRG